MAPHSPSALASSDTGPNDRPGAPDDEHAADGVGVPTVPTELVADPDESDAETAEERDAEPTATTTEDAEALDGPVTTTERDAEPTGPATPEDAHGLDGPTVATPAVERSEGSDESATPDGLDGPTVATAAVGSPETPANHGTTASGSAEGPADDDTTTIETQGRTGRFRLLPRSRWLLRTAAALAVVVLVLAAVATPSLVHALTRPGTDTVAARLAEWGRDHGFGPAVTWLEARQYDLDKPATGGVPAGGIPHANGAVADHPGGSPAPPPLPPPAGVAPLPGEGQWETVVSTPHGDAVRLTTVRPDAAHTSFLAGVLWMDPTLVRGVLHPGTEDPGGSWSVPTSIDTAEQRTVVSAFSSGFRLQGDSHGGWYLDGREARPLVPGAASLVIYKNGATDVGAWGSDVHMSPDVAAVRQNLIPLVDHGVVNPTCATGGTPEWGSTVGQAAYISRSAFGVTASGAEIYVGGPALSVCTLGDILRSAGAVRGMELDINPAWVSGAYFHPTGQSRPDAFQLFPGEQVGAQHYLQTSSRDFVSFDLRSLADATGAGVVAPSSQHHGGTHGAPKHPS